MISWPAFAHREVTWLGSAAVPKGYPRPSVCPAEKREAAMRHKLRILRAQKRKRDRKCLVKCAVKKPKVSGKRVPVLRSRLVYHLNHRPVQWAHHLFRHQNHRSLRLKRHTEDAANEHEMKHTQTPIRVYKQTE